MKGLISTIVFAFSSVLVFAQSTSFKVDDSQSIESMVRSFQGAGIEIFNIRYQQSNGQSVGAFEDVVGLLDMNKGLLMTSGNAALAIGPNNKGDAGAGNGLTAFYDSDLQSIVPNETLYDGVVIEFDIRGSNSILSFDYIFGSDEYPEYEHDFNDVFGFFLSGPGIDGVKNLAVLDDGTLVSVKSINSSKNTAHFVSNGAGDNPAKNFYLQYDGYTKKLVAKAEIRPCEIYHIKLAIADARDDILDSGVFIEQGSFTTTSKINVELAFEYKEYPYAVEGCNKGYFIVKKLPQWVDLNTPLELEFTLTGQAINGTDYALVPINRITIPEKEMQTVIEINALTDPLPEGTERVRLDIILRCKVGVVATASAEMEIRDEIDYPIQNEVCKDVLSTINTETHNRWVFSWQPNEALSCTDCSSPSVRLENDGQFPVKVKDIASGCETTTVAEVRVKQVTAYFMYSTDVNYTSVDAFFKNLSENTVNYEWNFGDGQTSDQFEPAYTFDTGGSLQPVSYTITLRATSEKPACTDEYRSTIMINPLYIPNVITPNNDCCNQFFTIKGIEPGLWKIIIYNRWGKLVYQSDNYRNDWAGDGLATGVYYYELSNPPGDRLFKGWLQLLR
jgi:gliding motility-associated-like protein